MRWWYRLHDMPKLRHVLVAATLFGLACGPTTSATPPQHAKTKPSASASVKKATDRPAPVSAVAIGQYGAGTFGPRVVRNGKQTIVVSAQRSSSGRRWMAQALDEAGVPRGDARHELAEAPEDTSSWDVKPVGDGFVLAWTRPTDGGQQLLTASLAADGSARSTPTALARSGDDLVAVVIVPLFGSGPAALLTWGEQTTAKGASVPTGTLFSFTLDGLGRTSAPAPTKLFEHLSAWQVTALANGGAVVAFIERNLKAPASAIPEQAPRSAKIASIAFAGGASGGSGKSMTLSDAVSLTTDETALPDVRVVSTGPGRVLAVWEDRRELDTHLFAQAIDVSSTKPKLLGTARRAAPPRGDQTLTALVATKLGPVLVWEAFHPRPPHEPRRRFELVRLSESGEAASTPRAIWYPYEEQEPEVAVVQVGGALSEEVALLTYGEACLDSSGSSEPTCDGIRPWLLRFAGPTLVPTQADLIDVGDVAGGPVFHAFDLACTPEKCEMLVDGPGDPSTVAIARVGHEPPAPGARWVYVDVIEPASTPPRLEAATTLARESQFAGLHAVRTTTGSSGSTLVAWITYAADDDLEAEAPPPEAVAEEGKKKKPKKPKKAKKGEGGAKVAVRLLDPTGEPLAPTMVVSERALSKGDVALAAGDGAKDGAIVAYVSRAEGDEEVYVAKIDPSGKKSGKSSRITHSDGSASDVALAALPEGGYLLAWVDGRKEAAAVYAVRLDKGGAKVGSEVKIGGGAGGDVSDLVLATNGIGSSGPRVVAAWSDARDDLTTGFGDIYVTIVAGKDPGKTLVAERALQKSRLHSHNPVVSTRPDGSTVFAWMEDDPQATEILELTGKPDWGAYVARLDSSGSVALPATQIAIDPQLGKGVVTGVALDCSATSGSTLCRLALAWSDRQGIAVLGTSLPSSSGSISIPPARAVWAYVGAPTQEVAPALVGSAIYLCEDGLEKDDGRVRRLSVAW